MTDHRRVLAEAIEALADAAESERPMRIGYDVARVLHAALLDAQDKPHPHTWQPLGYIGGADGTEPIVVMACACGSGRRVRAEMPT